MRMRRYCIMLPIDPVSLKGEYDGSILHCTLLHWFQIDKNEIDVADMIGRTIMRHRPILLKAEKYKHFGPKHNVPVHTLEQNKPLVALHRRLFEKFSSAGARYQAPTYIGNGYQPHVTISRGRSLPIGDAVLVSKVCLVCSTCVDNRKQEKRIVSVLRFHE